MSSWAWRSCASVTDTPVALMTCCAVAQASTMSGPALDHVARGGGVLPGVVERCGHRLHRVSERQRHPVRLLFRTVEGHVAARVQAALDRLVHHAGLVRGVLVAVGVPNGREDHELLGEARAFA